MNINLTQERDDALRQCDILRSELLQVRADNADLLGQLATAKRGLLQAQQDLADTTEGYKKAIGNVIQERDQHAANIASAIRRCAK
jgi:uncharacterized protein (DUF3084 family)